MRTDMSAGSARHPVRTAAEAAGRRLRFTRRTAAVFLVLAGVALGLTPAAPQEQITYAPLNVPGAAMVVTPVGINAGGQSVVNYTDAMGRPHAAVMTNGSLTEITIPGAGYINAFAINDAGQVVGLFYDATGMHGFFRSASGQISSIDFPGTSNTQARGINNAGQIVGTYFNQTGVHGFLRDVNGAYRSIDSPHNLPNMFYTVANAINNFGQIAGYYYGTSGASTAVSLHGFIQNVDGTFMVVDYPTTAPVVPSSVLTGLNDLGQAVGQRYQPSYGGFLTDEGGAFTKLDFPTNTTYYFTSPWGIDSASDIVGTYYDTTGMHGFMADPVAAALPADPPAKGTAPAGGQAITKLHKALCLRDKVESFFDVSSSAGGVSAIAVASRRTDLYTTDVVPFLSLVSLESLGYDYLACSQTASDPAFAQAYTPEIHGLPTIPATGGISPALAASLNDAIGHGSRAAAYLQAVSISLNRYHSAVAAGNGTAASSQESAALGFAKSASQELTAFAAGLQNVAGMIQGSSLDESVSSTDFLAAMGRIRSQGAAALPGVEYGGFRMFGLDPSYLLTGDTAAQADDAKLSTSLSGALNQTAKAVEWVADILAH